MSRLRRVGSHRWAYDVGGSGLVLTFEMRGNLLFSRKRRYNRANWSQVKTILQRANEEMAETLALLIVDELQGSLVRKKHSTGRLERATLAEENRRVTYRSVGVGVPRFLDSSDAKYWRQIEEGETVHVGRRLYGLWDASATGGAKWWYPHQSRYGMDRYVPFGVIKKKWDPTTLRVRSAEGRGSVERGVRGPMMGVRITRPIEPHEYYAKGMRRFREIPNYRVNALRRAIAEVLGVPLSDIPRGYEQIHAWL